MLLTSLFREPSRRQQPQRRFGSIENPSIPLSAGDDWMSGPFGDFRATSGVSVNRETALTYAAWWHAVNLIASDIAKLPVHVYRQGGAGKERDTKHPAYYLLRRKPNQEMTAYQWKRTTMLHVLQEGNGYSYIQRAGDGSPQELIPLMPWKTYPIRAAGKMWYITELKTGEPRKLLPENILHIKGLSYDGLIGYNMLYKARESLGLGMGLDLYGSVFFRNNAEPRVVLKTPKKLSPEARKNLRESWGRMHQGLENSHQTAILEEGLEAKPFSLSARDAQLIEQRRFSQLEVAHWFNLPPSKLGIKDSVSYNSLEQENNAYLSSAIDPWLVCIEEECDAKLLTQYQQDRDTHLIEFHRKSLMRADTAARTAYFTAALTNGWMSRDEVRAEDGMNPIPDGSGAKYFVPLNMGAAGGETDDLTPAAQQTPGNLIEVPDIRQPDHYSCGACAAMCVGQYFGVGPQTLAEWKAALGSDVEQSTKPMAIVEYLSRLGLAVTAKHEMTLDDLKACWKRGQPVICCVQDYGPFVPGAATFAYGHYLTVIGAGMGYVFAQDSSQDNVTKGDGDITAPGRIMVDEETWLANWHDSDVDGVRYVRFGIAVGRELLPVTDPAAEDLDTDDDEAEGKPGEEIEPIKQPETPTGADGPLRDLFASVCRRMATRVGRYARGAAKQPAGFLRWLDTITEHQAVAEEAFRPAVDLLNALRGTSHAAADVAGRLLAELRAGLLDLSGRHPAARLLDGVEPWIACYESGRSEPALIGHLLAKEK